MRASARRSLAPATSSIAFVILARVADRSEATLDVLNARHDLASFPCSEAAHLRSRSSLGWRRVIRYDVETLCDLLDVGTEIGLDLIGDVALRPKAVVDRALRAKALAQLIVEAWDVFDRNVVEVAIDASGRFR